MATQRHLLVDAYNVICATPELREAMHPHLETARDRLAERLRPIHDCEGIRVALILESRGGRLAIEHPFGSDTFEYLIRKLLRGFFDFLARFFDVLADALHGVAAAEREERGERQAEKDDFTELLHGLVAW